jgi:hypothetical protein
MFQVLHVGLQFDNVVRSRIQERVDFWLRPGCGGISREVGVARRAQNFFLQVTAAGDAATVLAGAVASGTQGNGLPMPRLAPVMNSVLSFRLM